MNIFCTGLNHHHSAVDMRERFSISSDELPAVLDRMLKMSGLQEVVVLSTCNRIEFYIAHSAAESIREELKHFLTQRTGIEPPLFEYNTLQSVQHLFRVASGLDSMVVGESEILGQVKQAYFAAAQGGATSRILNRLFQNAFQVAKQVRSETHIGRGATSVGAVAVELAGKIFGSLTHCSIGILGAGEIGTRTLRSLISRGATRVQVANRTYARALELAEHVGGKALPFDLWPEALQESDIFISAITSPANQIAVQHLVSHSATINHESTSHVTIPHGNPFWITVPQVEHLMRTRKNRPLFLIDLAVPRTIEPALNTLEGVFVYDIDSLQAIAQQSIQVRHRELARCEQMIETGALAFLTWLQESRKIRVFGCQGQK